MTKYYLKGCHLKDPKGCQNYAFYSFEKQKIKTSVKYFDKSCTLKNSRSCFILSKLYEELYNNEKVSMKYAEKACQLKDNPSCLSAAVKSKMQGKLVEYEYYTQKFCENLGKGKCTNKLLRATKESIHSLSIIKKEQIKTRKKRKFNPNDLKI